MDLDESRRFGELLRRHRAAAGLTQEALAARAGISARAIQDLEHGRRRPLLDTVRRLLHALQRPEADQAEFAASVLGEERARFEEAGRSAPRRAALGEGREPDAAPSHNVPASLTSLIGRDQELGELEHLLKHTRLLTLTGVGGCGKTRLASELATRALDAEPDGVWYVELAPLGDPDLVPKMVAGALGLYEQPGQPVTETLTTYLRTRRLLLVLDNCEHLLDACARLADVALRRCPDVRVLATSREALGIAGEVAWRVPSLAAPDADHHPTARGLLQYAAAQLFVERALAVQPDFAVTEQNAPVVAEVCRRLDGIPLALELAATRLRGLTVEQLAARLDDRFRLLTGGSRTALPRQRTLQATIDWSYDLLEEREQWLLRRLAVFAGGWTLEAAEAVCAGEELERDDVLGWLLRLVDQSLVLAEGGRYRLLETVRQYARDRLDASGEAEVVHERHAACSLAFAERVEREVTAGSVTRFHRLEVERENLRAALVWYANADDVEALLRLAGALEWFWQVGGHLSEGRRWLHDALSRGGEVGPGVREHALHAAGVVAWGQCDYARAEALLHQSVAGYRRLGDGLGVAWALAMLANATLDQNKFREAAACSDEALPLGRDQGDPVLLATLLTQQGIIARERGELDRAQALLDEALCVTRTDDRLGGATRILQNLGALAEDRHDHVRAHAYLRESLALTRQVGEKFNLPFALDSVASLAALEEQPERALRLVAASAALRERLGMRVPPMWLPRVERTLERARIGLDAASAEAAWAHGQALTMEEAIALALEEGGES